LFSGFERGASSLRGAGCRRVYLDGSFVSAKELPNDYDACWEAQGVNILLVDPVLLDFRNLRAAQKAKYFGEFFLAHLPAEATSPFRTFLDFFQTNKNDGSRKGIIGINL
jgi:hypothetical protein